MKLYLRALSIVCATLFVAPKSQARTITYDEKPITLDIRYGKSTVLRFDTKVSSIQNADKYEIGPLNDQQPNYAEILVRPRTITSVDTVNFHLVDGSVVMLRLQPVNGAQTDHIETFYAFKRKESQPEAASQALLAEASDDQDGSKKIMLMKALILGTKLRGYQIRAIDRALKTGIDGVEAILERVYVGKEFNGYVFKLINKTSENKYEIDIRRLKIGEPNLALMGQVDRRVLEPEASRRNIATLTLVALPSALSRDVVLPVAWIKKEAK